CRQPSMLPSTSQTLVFKYWVLDTELISKAILAARRREEPYASRIGAMIFLCSCEADGLGNYGRWVMYEKNPLIQAQVAPYLNMSGGRLRGAARSMLKRSMPDPSLGLVGSLVETKLTVDDIGVNSTQLHPIARNSLFAAGTLRDTSRPRLNPIGILLHRRYNIPNWQGWHELFGADYQAIHRVVLLLDSLFDVNPTSWLSSVDSFNDELVRAFQRFLASKGAHGAVSVVDRHGVPLDYGVVLKSKPRFQRTYPALVTAFWELHQRRSTLPSVHPFDKHTGVRSKPLNRKERSRMAKHFRDGLLEIIRSCEAIGF
ncbi:MAG: hypothetical protein O3B43_03645, partial [Chloroflexi bacterium]|nr:hypothetical protein [Chloroflexota bacterium]